MNEEVYIAPVLGSCCPHCANHTLAIMSPDTIIANKAGDDRIYIDGADILLNTVFYCYSCGYTSKIESVTAHLSDGNILNY